LSECVVVARDEPPHFALGKKVEMVEGPKIGLRADLPRLS
jgi:hypothetical protein